MGLRESRPKEPVIELESDISIFTFDDEKPEVKITVRGEEVAVETILRKAAYALNMQQRSLKYFGLFQGLHTPIRKYRAGTKVPIDTPGLFNAEVVVDPKEETDLVKDAVALYLACMQVRTEIEQGKLVLSEAQEEILREHDDPGFLVSMPYLEECQKMANYSSIPAGSAIILTVTQRGMHITFQGNKYFCSWRKIKSWTRPDKDLFITFEVYSIPTDTYSFLQLETPQAPYLLSAVIEMIKILQKETSTESFQTSDLTLDHDGTVLSWNNAVFSKSHFTAEKEMASNSTDLSTIPLAPNESGDAEVVVTDPNQKVPI
ncbi:hypothetical protein BSL78_05236 [Apostichopus japonicus]|uniref:FERM domain-containing protein n=1 Tax=Stichopus japonicus TaxID=307972 RepID=A0A2G8LC74_STIJA|nr:hypothetical protein BSL78_05236 [Apostichopus japonicus]